MFYIAFFILFEKLIGKNCELGQQILPFASSSSSTFSPYSNTL